MAAPLRPPASAPIRAPTPAPPMIFSASFVLVVFACWVKALVDTSILRPSARVSRRNATVIDATPLTRPPGSELSTTPSTGAPSLATTQSLSTIGRASVPVKESPALLVFVESSVVVYIESGVDEDSVKTRGGGGGGTGISAAATEPPEPAELGLADAALPG